jgi:hypothetical protein
MRRSRKHPHAHFSPTPRRLHLALACAAAFLTVVYSSTYRASADPSTSFSGTLVDRAGRAPLAGVEVALDDGEFTNTDEHGNFHFASIKPGKHPVKMSGGTLGCVVVTEIDLREGQSLEVTYPIDGSNRPDQDDFEVLVSRTDTPSR